jgi:putative ABC transport system permease protein
VLGRGLRLAAAGVPLGLAAALALARTLDGLLYDVAATDPETYAAVSFTLVAVAALACALPARRAARVDPMRVLGEG